jgi:hypothetical protein
MLAVAVQHSIHQQGMQVDQAVAEQAVAVSLEQLELLTQAVVVVEQHLLDHPLMVALADQVLLFSGILIIEP